MFHIQILSKLSGEHDLLRQRFPLAVYHKIVQSVLEFRHGIMCFSIQPFLLDESIHFLSKTIEDLNFNTALQVTEM